VKSTKIPWAVSGRGPGVLDRASVGLEHEVEVAGVGELAVATVRAHRRVGQVVGPEAVVAVEALDQGVRERLDVTGGLPHPWVHEDRGVEAHDVLPELHHRLPPGPLDVVLQLDPKGAVVPRGTQPSVDLGGLERDAPPLGEVHDRVESRSIHWLRHHAMRARRAIKLSSAGGRIEP
jgi:hypothetical protein